MTDQEIIDKLKELFPNGRISCTQARKLAQDMDVDPGRIGELCDEAGLKIFGCVLGCFG